ncbi:MAG: FHA domain-containing protein [Chloroflexota bacterium]
MAELSTEINPELHPQKIRFSIWNRTDAIEVAISQEILIGRADENLEVAVDLSPHHGRLLGVSRRHALVFLTPTGVGIRDLDSANGTSCNGIPLEPDTAYELQHGDELKLGGLYVNVYFSD